MPREYREVPERESISFDIQENYKEETEFTKDLAVSLNRRFVKTDKSKAEIRAEYEIKQGKYSKPDISVYIGDRVDLKYRKLSDPFYIECKLGNESYNGEKTKQTAMKQIQDNILQFKKYTFDRNSEKHQKMAKYGDNHVAVTTPKLLRLGNNFEDFQEEWVNRSQLKRTLWNLGVGVLFKDENGVYRIEFNQNEVLYIS